MFSLFLGGFGGGNCDTQRTLCAAAAACWLRGAGGSALYNGTGSSELVLFPFCNSSSRPCRDPGEIRARSVQRAGREQGESRQVAAESWARSVPRAGRDPCREPGESRVRAGRGECDCGECKCHAGYIGDNCNCTTETSSCVSGDGQMCSGKGNCVCGRCQCVEPGAFGETCDKCPTCPDACGTKRDCIECRLYQTGRLADNHTCHKLCKDEIILVDALEADKPEAVHCVYKTENECVQRFMYSEEENGKSILSVLKEAECVRAPDTRTVALAVVGSILLIGLVLLAVWKLLVTIHDRREFARFQSERSRAKYEMASNPLYRQPISTHTMDEVYSMMGKSDNGTSNGYRGESDNY